MAFVAIIPYSKFFHFIAIPFAALVKPDRKPPVLQPMDFEDEEAEEFWTSNNFSNEYAKQVGPTHLLC